MQEVGGDVVSQISKMKIYDLAQPLSRRSPIHPEDPPFILTMFKAHKPSAERKGVSFSSEVVVTGMHSSTHIDAPAHIARDGVLFGGLKAESLFTEQGYLGHGIESVPIIVKRGILLDIPRVKHSEQLPEGYGISADDLSKAEEDEGVRVSKGDCILVRTGYGKYFTSAPETYVQNYPGLTGEAAMWLADRKVFFVGADNLALGGKPRTVDAQANLLPDNGILIGKNLFLEELAKDRVFIFTLCIAPLKVVGATASLIRPFALTQ